MAKMLKCWTCEHQRKISRGPITPGGKQTYLVTCNKEKTTFNPDWDAHASDLPCWEVDK